MGIFDIIGPIMIGPSSSHTAGAARIGQLARLILNDELTAADITLYGSFAKTGRGHGTDKALVAGLRGYGPDSIVIRNAIETARKNGIKIHFFFSEEDAGHPNTAKILAYGTNDRKVEVVGRSLGGGRVMITSIYGYAVAITGEENTLLTHHKDVPGIVASVSRVLADEYVNISNMRVFRKNKGVDAVMIIHTDDPITEACKQKILACNPNIVNVMTLKKV